MTEEKQKVKLSLEVALSRYWKYLIGVALFPFVFFFGGEFFHIPFAVFVIPFFAVGLLAAWPLFRFGAPYLFWIVAMGVWMGGIILAVVLFQIINLIRSG